MRGTGIIFFLLALGLTAGVLFFLNKETEAPKDYHTYIQRQQTAYKHYLASDKSLDLHGDTSGISFYPINESYKVKTTVNILKKSNYDILHVQTSDSTYEKYIKFARLDFELMDQPLSLILLQSTDGGSFFLSFSDLTSGEESYGAGRYLPIEYRQDKEIELDFNMAFNPKCAYDHKFVCPIPPKENRLNVRIEAGEKTYKNNLQD